ncbi:hypothetical protein CHARACLAT_030369 [Characodon lateralis]|uniref:Uncharacterized protein n=1 Tax=Characodon lateralis TaxID=208331 RepID=A0ABU7CT27_9TELE|nr:hypothetical protein [Characodon lateralis]
MCFSFTTSSNQICTTPTCSFCFWYAENNIHTASEPLQGPEKNHAETCSCTRARAWFSGQFQGPGWVPTSVIRSRNPTLAWYKAFQKFGLKGLLKKHKALYTTLLPHSRKKVE